MSSKLRQLIGGGRIGLRLGIWIVIFFGMIKLYGILIVSIVIAQMMGITYFANNQDAMCIDLDIPDCVNFIWTILNIGSYGILIAFLIGIYGIYHLTNLIDKKILARYIKS